MRLKVLTERLHLASDLVVLNRPFWHLEAYCRKECRQFTSSEGFDLIMLRLDRCRLNFKELRLQFANKELYLFVRGSFLQV